LYRGAAECNSGYFVNPANRLREPPDKTHRWGERRGV